jgi:hypothetical protein
MAPVYIYCGRGVTLCVVVVVVAADVGTGTTAGDVSIRAESIVGVTTGLGGSS